MLILHRLFWLWDAWSYWITQFCGAKHPNAFCRFFDFQIFPQTVYCWGSQCCLKCVRLGWGAVSASLGLSPNLFPNLSPIWLCLSPWLGCCVRLAGLVCGLVSQFVSHLALSFTLAGVLCPPCWACLWFCLPICLPSGFVFHLGWGAVSASLGLSAVLSPNLSPIWLCLSPWLGCCVRLAGLVCGLVSQFVSHLALSFTLAGGLRLSPNLSPIWLCLSPWLGCCVRLAGLVSQCVSHLALSFTLAGVLCPPRLVSQFVSHLALSFTLVGVLCPPRWACLPICLPSRFVFHLGGCCVRLAGLVSQFVSQFVSHLALSFTLAGVLCPPRWACLRSCLPICLPSGFVFHLGWGAVSALLGLSVVLSPNLSPIWLCLSPWLGCCVRLAGLVCGLVSQFVSHLALSFTLAGVLCPPRWACLRSCLRICLPSGFVSQFCPPICFPSGFVFHLGWGAVSASLGLSAVLSPNLSPIWPCLPICSPSGFVFHLGWGAVSASLGLSPNLSSICLPSAFVFHLGWGAVSASLGFSLNLSPASLCLSPAVSASLGLSPNLSPIWLCLSPWLGCPPRWPVSGLVSQLVSHLVWDALSASLVLSFSCLWSCLPAFVFVLSRSLSFIWDAVSAPPWACLFLVSGLVSQLVSHLVWDAVFAFLARLPAQLVSGLLPHPVFQLVWCVRALGLPPKFHVRCVQLFGVYGGVIFISSPCSWISFYSRFPLRTSKILKVSAHAQIGFAALFLFRLSWAAQTKFRGKAHASIVPINDGSFDFPAMAFYADVSSLHEKVCKLHHTSMKGFYRVVLVLYQ